MADRIFGINLLLTAVTSACSCHVEARAESRVCGFKGIVKHGLRNLWEGGCSKKLTNHSLHLLMISLNMRPLINEICFDQ